MKLWCQTTSLTPSVIKTGKKKYGIWSVYNYLQFSHVYAQRLGLPYIQHDKWCTFYHRYQMITNAHFEHNFFKYARQYEKLVTYKWNKTFSLWHTLQYLTWGYKKKKFCINTLHVRNDWQEGTVVITKVNEYMLDNTGHITYWLHSACHCWPCLVSKTLWFNIISHYYIENI